MQLLNSAVWLLSQDTCTTDNNTVADVPSAALCSHRGVVIKMLLSYGSTVLCPRGVLLIFLKEKLATRQSQQTVCDSQEKETVS